MIANLFKQRSSRRAVRVFNVFSEEHEGATLFYKDIPIQSECLTKEDLQIQTARLVHKIHRDLHRMGKIADVEAYPICDGEEWIISIFEESPNHSS
ncbi:MAG: hypothetical protein JWM68_2062 [Verrucomicrobiales bacterium]|nr:hypothetical protein [Verrucomicrobiales bacterium]